ncbi:Ldh family oxidoreductase [Chloroflexota bacterium]
MTTEERTRVGIEKLTNFSARILQKLGVPEEDAIITARILVACDLRGVESHGVGHLVVFYVKRIKDGAINVTPNIKLTSTAASTATMDGDSGLGFVVGYRAMEDAIKRAKDTGAGFVAVRNSTHFGAGAYYAMMALEHNMIGFSATNTGAGVVAPGASSGAVGTNPLAVAIPAGNKPDFVLDMATSVVAAGKLELARMKGEMIPEGWAIDKDGNPITDPTKRVRGEGGMLPLGGTPALGVYKGFGLGVAVEILCGILSGAIARLLVPRGDPATAGKNDHFFGALRIDSFTPIPQFKQSMDDFIEAIENLPKLPGVKNIYTPGGVEAPIVADRKANGIPLHPKVLADLKGAAEELGVDFDIL